MEINDQAPVSDKVEIQHNQGGFRPNMVKVRVLAEAGIFKNGQQYEKGAEAVISREAALNFQQVGEVEILEAQNAENV
jgi:hypothetical protein